MDWGWTALSAQCKTGSSFLRGIRCFVGGGSCLTLTVQGGRPCVVVVFMVLTAPARRCKTFFFLLPGTRCRVGEETCLTPGVRGGGPGGTEGGEGVPCRSLTVQGVEPCVMVVFVDLTALSMRCKTSLFLLPGTLCLVGEGACLTPGVRGGGPGGTEGGEGVPCFSLTVQGVGPCVMIVFVDLTALSRRCKMSFSLLPGTRCLVGEEACLTPGVRGGGPGGAEGGGGVLVRTVAGAGMLSKTAFLCAV